MERIGWINIDSHSCLFVGIVPPEQIVYLQVLVESYEGLGTVRTLEQTAALVCILCTPSTAPVIAELLESERDRLLNGNVHGEKFDWREPKDVPEWVRQGKFSEIDDASVIS